jgi:hypothetical protein
MFMALIRPAMITVMFMALIPGCATLDREVCETGEDGTEVCVSVSNTLLQAVADMLAALGQRGVAEVEELGDGIEPEEEE